MITLGEIRLRYLIRQLNDRRFDLEVWQEAANAWRDDRGDSSIQFAETPSMDADIVSIDKETMIWWINPLCWARLIHHFVQKACFSAELNKRTHEVIEVELAEYVHAAFKRRSNEDQ